MGKVGGEGGRGEGGGRWGGREGERVRLGEVLLLNLSSLCTLHAIYLYIPLIIDIHTYSTVQYIYL